MTGISEGLRCASVSFHRRAADGNERVVLAPFDAHFRPGELSLLTGPTGAGKSTLIALLAGLTRPTSGQILAGGKPVSRWLTPHRDRWRREVGIVFQHLHLIRDLTVRENILLPLVPRHVSPKEAGRRLEKLLTELGIDHLERTPVNRLSGGERQRTAIARALIVQPRYLLADEPFAHQDAAGVERIIQRFASLAHTGAVVLLSGHFHQPLPSLSNCRRFHLEAGRLTESNAAPAGPAGK